MDLVLILIRLLAPLYVMLFQDRGWNLNLPLRAVLGVSARLWKQEVERAEARDIGFDLRVFGGVRGRDG
jgi:hypothetical protein